MTSAAELGKADTFPTVAAYPISARSTACALRRKVGYTRVCGCLSMHGRVVPMRPHGVVGWQTYYAPF